MAVTANIALFSTLRIYALWQGSPARWPFSVAVLVLGLVPVGTNIYGWTQTSFEYVRLPVLSSCEEWTDLTDNVGNLRLPHEVLRHRVRRARACPHVGEVAEPVPGDAQAWPPRVCVCSLASRWNAVLYSAPRDERPRAPHLRERPEPGRRLRERLRTISTAAPRTALHAQPAPARRAARRRGERRAAPLALLAALPRPDGFPREYRGAARG
ncbi:hypothetical protein PsYK624_154770 [Phanerochaete sordida]|uniref:Uncharacterized protein n=1 Tax=Phanerochaete sordida TaxID=48140 RepID=A0A9P3GPA8_9APHY|nr:hypothetical protein PsYK624_154770 [Phanerochaete sordida]